MRFHIWGLFAVGVFSIYLGFYGIYLERARQDWVITNAQVLSLDYLEESPNGPQEDPFRLEVSYRLHNQEVKAQMNSYGHQSFTVGDTIPVRIDPSNYKHFVFHERDGKLSIAALFVLGIVLTGYASWYLFRRKIYI